MWFCTCSGGSRPPWTGGGGEEEHSWNFWKKWAFLAHAPKIFLKFPMGREILEIFLIYDSFLLSCPKFNWKMPYFQIFCHFGERGPEIFETDELIFAHTPEMFQRFPVWGGGSFNYLLFFSSHVRKLSEK